MKSHDSVHMFSLTFGCLVDGLKLLLHSLNALVVLGESLEKIVVFLEIGVPEFLLEG